MRGYMPVKILHVKILHVQIWATVKSLKLSAPSAGCCLASGGGSAEVGAVLMPSRAAAADASSSSGLASTHLSCEPGCLQDSMGSFRQYCNMSGTDLHTEVMYTVKHNSTLGAFP